MSESNGNAMYSEMNVAELRKLCSQKNLGAGTWRAGASKSELVKALETGTVESAPKPTHASDDLATVLAEALKGKLNASVNADEVRALIQEQMSENTASLLEEVDKRIASMGTKEIEVIVNNGPKVNVGKQHFQFEKLLKIVASGVPVWLTGPAGSGKTTAAENVAKALNLPFYFNGAIDSEYKLLGFTDAQGRVVSRPFRKAFTEGGVYLFDEVDASLPGALLAFNAALANGICDFPDGAFPRHKDFRVIAAANTFDGTGEYVGRIKQDYAFLDRFVSLRWDYDENLEDAIAGNKEWSTFVQKCRSNAKKHGLKAVISPRASIFGALLLAAGIDRKEVIESTITKGLNAENARKIIGD